jgi:hypothetical protein
MLFSKWFQNHLVLDTATPKQINIDPENHGFLKGNSTSKPYLPGLNLLKVIRLMGPPHSILDARLLSALQLRGCSL